MYGNSKAVSIDTGVMTAVAKALKPRWEMTLRNLKLMVWAPPPSVPGVELSGAWEQLRQQADNLPRQNGRLATESDQIFEVLSRVIEDRVTAAISADRLWWWGR